MDRLVIARPVADCTVSMPYHPDDTICAIATAAGGAARGMVRISGPDAIAVVVTTVSSCTTASRSIGCGSHTQCAGTCGSHSMTTLGQAAVRLVCLADRSQLHARTGGGAAHVWFAAAFGSAAWPQSARPVLGWPSRANSRLRAFLAGRIDLTQAEAVLGVIDARARDELSTRARANGRRAFASRCSALRDELLQLLAELEAGLDFVEEDIEFVSQSEIVQRLQSAAQLLTETADQLASRHARASGSANRAPWPAQRGKEQPVQCAGEDDLDVGLARTNRNRLPRSSRHSAARRAIT